MRDGYVHGHQESVLRSHRWRTAENSAAYLLPHLRPGMSVLDVGCGPGTITADLAATVAPGAVTAAELTETAARGLANVTVAVTDVHALGFADDCFDVVHAHQVLQHVADPVAALREMRRVCRPGGLVAARDSDYAGFAWFPALPELSEWLALYRRVAQAAGGQPDAGRRLLSWAQAAGFVDLTATSSTWCFASPADRAWWGGTWADRMVDSDLARRATASGAATTEDLRRISLAWRRWAAAENGWMSILHGEILCRA